jgi:hypothetical protein
MSIPFLFIAIPLALIPPYLPPTNLRSTKATIPSLSLTNPKRFPFLLSMTAKVTDPDCLNVGANPESNFEKNLRRRGETEFPEVVDEVSGLRQEMAHLQHEVEVLNLQKKDKTSMYRRRSFSIQILSKTTVMNRI